MPGLPNANSVKASIFYAKRPLDGQPLETYLYELPEGKTHANNVETEERILEVTDLRTVDKPWSLKENGFRLANMTVPADLDWQDADKVKQVYYPRLEEMLLRETGGSRVHIFDHTLRNGKAKDGLESATKLSNTPAKRGLPVTRAHVDYTLNSGVNRLKVLLPDEWEKLQQTPYAVIQVWRPIVGPVDESPLAMADAATVDQTDLIPNILHFPGRDGEVYACAYNPAHRWYYAKGIDVDEAYVFVCYDSREGRARFTPHTGFIDPTTKEDAAPRRSVESRAYVFWENEAA